MAGHHTLADRLRARAAQLGLPPAHVAEMAGLKRSFVYDILRGRSTRPGVDKLGELAKVLKVDRDWLIYGVGDVEGASPFVENPDETFVAIAHAAPRAATGDGAVGTDEADRPGRVYHFRRSWIRDSLKASPSQLRIMHVVGDGMAPTLLDGDTVLVDMARRVANPPGIFALDDGMGLVVKRLEHIANSDPSAVRIISDNERYPDYERDVDAIQIVGRIRWFAREI